MSEREERSSFQSLAIRHVEVCARSRADDARREIGDVLRMSNLPWEAYEDALSSIRANARVALHFHPDRPAADGRSVAESLLEDGMYRSQFDTGISNGSVSAYPGGARDLWERKLFGGAYHREGAANAERPKYGALDLLSHPDGPAPRFGSCYLLLAPGVSRRCTFTYLDSHQDPDEKGTLDEFDDVMAALLRDAFLEEGALGERPLTPRRLLNRLKNGLGKPRPDPSSRSARRNLNAYIEAQVHGAVSLSDDADVLVADPSFRGTDAGRTLERLASLHSLDLRWHRGFELRADRVPADFRGPGMPSLAGRIARNGRVDAAAIGAAAFDLKRNPEAWSDRGSYGEVLQELKYLWHVLVRYGQPVPVHRLRSLTNSGDAI